ncbi:hypothetical protein [Nostoc sp.]
MKGKIKENTYLKPLPSKQSTPLNERIGIWAILGLVSMTMLQNLFNYPQT